jgi:hypothetical protein
MNRNWVLREYKEGDEESINPLLNLVYKIDRGLPYWNWEFKGNPGGFNAFIAVDGQRMMGHLASINREIRIGDSEHNASLYVEGVIHPDYRKKGIFVALDNKLRSHLISEKIALGYGFPNDNSLPIFKKLGYTEFFNLNIMIRPMNFKNISEKTISNRILRVFFNLGGRFAFKLLYRSKKVKHVEGVEIGVVNEFDSRFDDFWESVETEQKIILKRDSKYLNWRYNQCPEKQYRIFVAEKEGKIMAWAVVRILEKFNLKNGAIVDIMAHEYCWDIVTNLMMKIEEYFKKERVDLVAVSIPKWSIYNRIFRRGGYMPCPRRMNPKEERIIIYPLSNESNNDFVTKATNWYITWGDTDVV